MKKQTNQKVPGRYLNWTLRRRNGIWVADPRSGNPQHRGLKIKSLGTSDYQAAVQNLHRLDLITAVKLGLASRSLLISTDEALLYLETGREKYMNYARRPEITGGVRPQTAEKYDALFKKFIPYAITRGFTTWNGVTTEVVEGYAEWMEKEKDAFSFQYFELNFIKQVIKWMIKRSYLPQSHQIDLRLRQPTQTTTYCYTAAEVDAIIDYCHARPPLQWVGHAVILLSRTGMRVSELVAARWSDLDPGLTVWTIVDESRQGTVDDRLGGRSTKSRKSRQVPIQQQVRATLRTLREQKDLDDRILHMPNGEPLNPDTLCEVLRREVLTPLSEKFPAAEGKKGLIDGRVHSLRHYFTSYCANNNVPERTVTAWLGHSNSRMIKRYYHLKDDESLRRMESLSFANEAKNPGNAIDTTVVTTQSL